jgi:hypothetical protein
MRKLLFNYSFYSHPEIGNFRVWHMSSRTSLFTEMHLGHDTMVVCLSKLVIALNESLWATLDIWLIPYYHSSLCLEYGGMSQIFRKSYSFEVDACTPWHRIDSSKMQLACVGSVLILKIYLVLGLCDPIDPFVTIVLRVCLMASHKWWYFTQVHNIPKSLYLSLSLSNTLGRIKNMIWIISNSSKIGEFWI